MSVEPRVTQPQVKPKQGIANILAVAAGKGGVGKSTVAVNLALTLVKKGARVGLLDADIHGPSQSKMLGGPSQARITPEKKIVPIEQHGLYAISIAHVIQDEAPAVWRGPMISGALLQLLEETQWPLLDYLIIDLPPGTGDIQLTLAQKIPLAGVVMVTTPQEVALLDVRKGIKMFQKVAVPLLGIVENMSLHRCSACGHEESLFGAGGGQQLSEEFELPLLGQLPLDAALMRSADQGVPWMVRAEEGHTLTQAFYQIGAALEAQLALRPIHYAAKLPPIKAVT